MPTVYRVEDTFGGGPYRGMMWEDRRLRDMGYAHTDDAHPTPWADPELREAFDREPAAGWLFGFGSVDDLAAWFGEWLAVLDAVGFYVSTYDVPEADVRRGTGQVVFSAGERVDRVKVGAFIMARESLDAKLS